jgi:DivIVA domain-containing protein
VIGHTRAIATDQTPRPDRRPPAVGAGEQPTGSLERVGVSERGRRARIAEVRDASFPIALRGYEREAVDAYVERVQSLISELEASGSPEAAVRRALDQVGEETSSILQRAQQTANEITERSRASADDRVREAEREARAITADAEDRVRELEADYGAIWAQRDRLLEQVRDLAERLLATADDAAERFPTQEEEVAAEIGGDATGSIPALDAPEAEAGGDEPSEEELGVREADDDVIETRSEGEAPGPGAGSARGGPPRAPAEDGAGSHRGGTPPVGAPEDGRSLSEGFSSEEELDFVEPPPEEDEARGESSEVGARSERRSP